MALSYGRSRFGKTIGFDRRRVEKEELYIMKHIFIINANLGGVNWNFFPTFTKINTSSLLT